MILKKILSADELRAQAEVRERHRLAIEAERKEKFDAWMAKYWPQVVAMPTSARLMKSVNRPHQKRGVPQPKHNPAPLPARLRHGKKIYPVWPGHTPEKQKKAALRGDLPRVVITLRTPAAIGRAPRPQPRRLAQAGQSAIEYTFLIALVAIVAIALAVMFGGQVTAFLQHLYTILGGL